MDGRETQRTMRADPVAPYASYKEQLCKPLGKFISAKTGLGLLSPRGEASCEPYARRGAADEGN